MSQELSEEDEHNLSEAMSVESSLDSGQKMVEFDMRIQDLPLNDTPQKTFLKSEDHSSFKSVELEIEPPMQKEEQKE